MNWTEVTIITTPEACEAICGLLNETGVGGVSIEDPTLLLEENRVTHDWDVLDDEVTNRYRENKAVIKAYYPPDTNMEDKLLLIREGITRAQEYLDFGNLQISYRSVDEQDWENSWKKYYKPIEIGKRILIKPQWESVQTNRDVIIELDPGMAFGTGTHETTRMCLRLLERFCDQGKDMLDIGTGSGILSIGGVKLGVKSCLAIDIDPTAVKIAKENAALNGVEDQIEIRCGNLAFDVTGTYDIVVANIIANAIIELSKTAARYVRSGGIFIASGIIKEREEEVVQALISGGFTIEEILTEGDWIAVVCR